METCTYLHHLEHLNGINHRFYKPTKGKIINKGKHLNIYNIGTQEEVSISKVVKLIGKYFKREIIIIKSPGHPGSTQRRCPNIAKIKLLGYKPKTKLKLVLIS